MMKIFLSGPTKTQCLGDAAKAGALGCFFGARRETIHCGGATKNTGLLGLFFGRVEKQYFVVAQKKQARMVCVF